MPSLASVKSLGIYTSTSRPTVQLTVSTSNHFAGKSCLPRGYEDSESESQTATRLDYKMLRAIEDLEPELIANEFSTQDEFDDALCALTESVDDTIRYKVRYITSAAWARACAAEKGLSLYQYLREIGGERSSREFPVPIITLLSGGQVATTPFKVQAIMIAPTGIPSLPDAIRAGSEVSEMLGLILRTQGKPYAIGDEGGFSTSFQGRDSRETLCSALRTVVLAIKEVGYKPGSQVQIAIDFAAKYRRVSTDHYALISKDEVLSTDDVADLCAFVADSFPLFLIEDPLASNEDMAMLELHHRLKGKTMLAADDLAVDIGLGIGRERKWDAVVLMPDRLGTITDTIKTTNALKKTNFVPIASHRSGETEDTMLADLAIALSLPFVKAGGMSGAERTGKYNQLLRIAETIAEVRYS